MVFRNSGHTVVVNYAGLLRWGARMCLAAVVATASTFSHGGLDLTWTWTVGALSWIHRLSVLKSFRASFNHQCALNNIVTSTLLVRKIQCVRSIFSHHLLKETISKVVRIDRCAIRFAYIANTLNAPRYSECYRRCKEPHFWSQRRETLEDHSNTFPFLWHISILDTTVQRRHFNP